MSYGVAPRGAGHVVSLDETANLLVVQPALENKSAPSALPCLIDEMVTERITRAIRFCARTLEYIDSTQRISHIAPVVGPHLGQGFMTGIIVRRRKSRISSH